VWLATSTSLLSSTLPLSCVVADGEVWLATKKSTNEACVIKRIHDCFDTPCDARMAIEEMRILRMVRHPNIVHLRDVLAPKDGLTFDDLHLVFELMDTDLEYVIHRAGVQSMFSVQSIGLGVLCGLRHLHTLHVLHRDLKPANILVSRHGDVKLCDFGLSRAFSENEWRELMHPDHERKRLRTGFIRSADDSSSSPDRHELMDRPLTGRVVTCDYRAPEVCLELGYSAAIDMWSFGAVMAELCLVLGDAKVDCNQRRRLFDRAPQDKQGDPFPSLGTLRAIIRVVGAASIDEGLLWLEPHPQALIQMRALLAEPFAAAHPFPRLQKLMPGAPAAAIELVTSILHFDPMRRPTAASAMNHPFLRNAASRCLPGGVWWQPPPVAPELGASIVLAPYEVSAEERGQLRRLVLKEIEQCRHGSKPHSPLQATGAGSPLGPMPSPVSSPSEEARRLLARTDSDDVALASSRVLDRTQEASPGVDSRQAVSSSWAKLLAGAALVRDKVRL